MEIPQYGIDGAAWVFVFAQASSYVGINSMIQRKVFVMQLRAFLPWSIKW
jgi:hypothetical protein